MTKSFELMEGLESSQQAATMNEEIESLDEENRAIDASDSTRKRKELLIHVDYS